MPSCNLRQLFEALPPRRLHVLLSIRDRCSYFYSSTFARLYPMSCLPVRHRYLFDWSKVTRLLLETAALRQHSRKTDLCPLPAPSGVLSLSTFLLLLLSLSLSFSLFLSLSLSLSFYPSLPSSSLSCSSSLSIASLSFPSLPFLQFSFLHPPSLPFSVYSTSSPFTFSFLSPLHIYRRRPCALVCLAHKPWAATKKRPQELT